MPFVSLKVTPKVVKQAKKQGPSARQIAIHDCSPELRSRIDSANGANRLPVRISGEFELAVGDNYAIWATHQAEPGQLLDFENIYEVLARRPDRPVKFKWD